MSFDIHIIFTSLLCGFLILVTVYDLGWMIIPNWLNTIIFFTGLIWVLQEGVQALAWALLTSVLVFAIGWGLNSLYQWRRERSGIGGGDVKFAAAIVPWIGLAGIPTMVLFGSSLALVVIALRACLGAPVTRQTSLAFGPFLATGACWVWFFGPLAIAL